MVDGKSGCEGEGVRRSVGERSVYVREGGEGGVCVRRSVWARGVCM